MKWMWIALMVSSGALGRDLYTGYCGGEGPHPWSNQNTESRFKQVRTEGLVKEFLYWENKDSLVYRNEKNKIFQLGLKTGQHAYLSQIYQPLSQVIDNRERFLLPKRDSWFLDAASTTPRWIHFDAFDPIEEHLYWQYNVLYSLASRFDFPDSRQKMDVYVYRAGETKAISCSLNSNSGEQFHVAKGHEFPWVYLYQTAPSTEPGKTKLTLYKIRVSDGMGGKPCTLKKDGEFTNPIFGNITDVHFFKDGNVAIRTDHPTHSMMWWTRTSCKYVSFGNKEVLVPNYNHSTLFTYDASEGLQMYYPDEAEPVQTQVLKNVSLSHVGHGDLWLSAYGKKLFVASKARGTEDKVLFEANLTPEF